MSAIEMLYERLNSYNKQDLFNYGYLLESNQILCKDMEEKDKEIERLNNIIDGLEDLLEIKKARMLNENDYSKSYLEGYDTIISANNLSHSGIMLETVKSSVVKTCDDILDKLKSLKEGK